MGNGITKNPCFSGDPYAAAVASDPPPNDSLGHSFTYVPSSSADYHHTPAHVAAAAMIPSEPSAFFSLSGAAISANQAASASMPSLHLFNEMTWPPSCACTFESSRSFAAAPLQPAPPSRLSMSGPLQQAISGRFSDTSASTVSGTISDGGPFLSGALDRSLSNPSARLHLQKSGGGSVPRQLMADRRLRRQDNDQSSFLGFFARTASKLRFRRSPSYYVRRTDDNESAELAAKVLVSDGAYRSPPNGNVEWAQGAAGEDRFHVAVSEERGWVFVGIYDGFNGPDATDYLFANLYVAVHDELKGVLWDDTIHGCDDDHQDDQPVPDNADDIDLRLTLAPAGAAAEVASNNNNKRRRTERRDAAAVHRDVLRALARALRKTEEAFFAAAEQRAAENPELGMVGSCVLVMLMKGADVYVMNVGDSRAVLARSPEPDLDILGKAAQDLRQFKTEVMRELHAHHRHGLQAVQLTPEHSTAVEEVIRSNRFLLLLLLHCVNVQCSSNCVLCCRNFGRK